jgi:oxazoline/thiazoline dehydrogenase
MLNPEDTYRLSRHIAIRPARGGFVLESPLNGRRFALKSPSLFRLLLALTEPTRVAELLDGVGEAQRAPVREFLEHCHAGGLLVKVEADGATEEERGALAHWEFHDLLFHASSRMGRNRDPVGGTYRFRGVLPEEPYLHPRSAGEGLIALPGADLERLGRDDISLTAALERRRTRYGMRPLNVEALGEFLYRTCRVTKVVSDEEGHEFARKVYPSGGAMHPLEVYVAAADCEGLERGLYHYRPLAHALAPVRPFDADVERLMADARQSIGGQLERLPLLFVISARFRRTAWKYQGIAYHLILMEVGALYQTMYLVATAMGLTPCALGCGDSDLFARLIGSDYYMETSVGEFILGGSD